MNLKNYKKIPIIAAALIAVAAVATASDLGDRLDRELKGAWGVLEVEVYSACGSTYSDNEVGGAGVASKAPHRFEAGEIVKIDKVKVKRQRVDLLLTLAAGFRISHTDGPFELFDEHECRAQMIFSVPRQLVKEANATAILDHIGPSITLFPNLAEAEDSDAWNGREIEPLPADYDETLRRHAVWKAEQTNAAVREATDQALDDAADAVEGIRDDEDYLAGFAAGAEEMSSFSTTDCSSLLTTSLSYHDKSAPKEESSRWKNGWEDGQKLVFNTLLADRLRSCVVPVPPSP